MTLWWQQLALVMAGGALGAAGRFLVGGWATRQLGAGVPWGTLLVNLLGCFAAGWLLVWLEGRGPAALPWRAFLMVGVLGALTTWSALVVELHLLQRTAGYAASVAYFGGSLVGSVLLLAAGMRLAEAMR